MIGRDARDILAENIRHLVSGVISNDEFEDRVPWKSIDPAVREITLGGPWHLYSDIHAYRLKDEYRVSDAQQTEAARWILFLKSELPYEWPQANRFVDLLWGPLIVLTLGYISRLRRHTFAKHGDISVWPFLRVADFERATASP